MVKTTVYLPEALKLRITQVAAQEGTSEAELIRTALEQYTVARARPRPRLPLFEGNFPIDVSAEKFDDLLEGFGED